ncbi:MAG: dihydropyrimidinase [Rhodospirillales bacterium]
MADFDVVIRGGTVATASGVFEGDVGIAGEQVVAVGKNLSKGAREIDAKRRIVFPGGVDSHCHIEQPSSTGGVNADTFLSGTRAAICGGTTSVICFAPQFKSTHITTSTADYHARAERGATCDYSFHLIVNRADKETLDALPSLIAQGHRTIKVFMTYPSNRVDDTGLLNLMALARKNQAFMVIHAEHHDMIMWMMEQLTAKGLTEAKHHCWSKPPVVEREAVHRVAAMAELMDQPVQIFHVTCGEAAEEIRRAQARGLKIWGETCTQYLTLTSDDLDKPNGEGAKWVCSPAPRSTEEHDKLWGYIKSGVLDIVSSDHAPSNFGENEGEKLPDGPNTPFTRMPNGVPGLETRLPILFSKGVVEGRIDLETFAAISSRNPARLFGLKNKGDIAPGKDADIAIWDPDAKVTIKQENLHHDVNYTPYEGMTVTGWPTTTLSRGEVLWDDGEFKATPGRGRFLARDPYEFIKPRGIFPGPFNPFE